MPAQSGLYHRLSWDIRAHTHVRQHVQALDVILRNTLVAGKYHPSNAISGNHMRLRQTGERYTEQVRSQRCDRNMLQSIHDQTIVNLIGENNELMFSGNVDDLLQQFLWIKRSGRIIWIDDDNCLGLIRDFRADIVDIGIPFGSLITDVMHGGTASQIHAGGPQRMVRRRHQHLVAIIQQRGQRQVDELADAIAGEDIIDGDVRNILELCILHDGFACREQTLGW